MPNRTMPDDDTEGFGLVTRDANACGRHVVGGTAGGAVEAVVDDETGILVDGNDTSYIAEKLLYLLENNQIAKQMSEVGLSLAIKNNTKAVSAHLEKYTNIF